MESVLPWEQVYAYDEASKKKKARGPSPDVLNLMPPPYESRNTSRSTLASSTQADRQYVPQDHTRLRLADTI
ncbi:hypothetical protein LTR95_001043 [Oleoguttula sp. CCFEE 5521]